jgi:hypothetical protein
LPPVSAAPSEQGLVILAAVPFPNPNPRGLRVHLQGDADRLRVRVYTRNFVLLAERASNAQPAKIQAGWSEAALPDLTGLSNGAYIAEVVAERDGRAPSGRRLVLWVRIQ